MVAVHPDLPGLDYVADLGSGGFADVYAYDQRLPRRRVAVKVLRSADASGAAAAAFLAEANAMAKLDHPNVVAVHSAGVAADGRPYLVMPYFAGGTLATRLADGPLGVAEVLRIGVGLGAAVETAHRNGLLHRDIKPANVLLNQYGTASLADFGLVGSPEDGEAAGLSVPWSAPEIIYGQAHPSVLSDVYALAATLWTLLAGAAPYEAVDDERLSALVSRIRQGALPRLPRDDVPAGLESLLRRGLDRDPGRRPPTALALAEGLREVQLGLGLPPSELILGSAPPGRPPAPVTLTSGLLVPTEPRPALALADTLPAAADAPVAQPAPTPAPAPGRPRRRWPVVLVAALVAALVAGAALALLTRGGGPVPALTATRDGDRVVFAWTHPDPRPGDAYAVQVANRALTLSVPRLAVTSAARVCLTVQVVDAGGVARGPRSEEACA